MKYLDENGLLYYDGKVKNRLLNKVDKENGKGLSTNDYTTAEKTKLGAIEAGAEVNVIEEIEVNGVEATISGKKASVTIETGSIDTIKKNGTALPISNKTVDISVPTKTSDITNDSNYQNATQVSNAIASAIASTYKPAGSIAFADLPALSVTNLGKVYNITNSFTTTADFVEGSGKTYPAGTNVAIITTGTNVYKYDVMSGFVDLSNYYTKSEQTPITNAEIDTIVGE